MPVAARAHWRQARWSRAIRIRPQHPKVPQRRTSTTHPAIASGSRAVSGSPTTAHTPRLRAWRTRHMRPATSRPTVIRQSCAALPASCRIGSARNKETVSRHQDHQKVQTPPIRMAGPARPATRSSLSAGQDGVQARGCAVALSAMLRRSCPTTRQLSSHQIIQDFAPLRALATPSRTATGSRSQASPPQRPRFRSRCARRSVRTESARRAGPKAVRTCVQQLWVPRSVPHRTAIPAPRRVGAGREPGVRRPGVAMRTQQCRCAPASPA